MISYHALTSKERRLPLVAIANLVPFALALVGIGIMADDGFGIEYWGLGEYLLLAFIVYLPVALLFPILALRLNIPQQARERINDLLITWGGLNLIICAVFLVSIMGWWEFL